MTQEMNKEGSIGYLVHEVARLFRRRFEDLEGKLRQQGRKPGEASLDEMESLWQESKQQEKP